MLSLPALLICLLPLDAVFGYGIDPTGAMGGFILFVIFAPLATVTYVASRYVGGPTYQRITVISMSILWGSPVLVAVLYFALRPFF